MRYYMKYMFVGGAFVGGAYEILHEVYVCRWGL